MQRMIWRLGTLVVCLAVLAAAMAAVRAQGKFPRPDPEKYLTQPSEWVAVTYTLEFTAGGIPRGPGSTIYRSGDGSTRHVTPTANGETETLIENSRTKKHYRQVNDGNWVESPLRARPFDGKPVMVLRKDHKLRQIGADDPRVRSLARNHPQLTFWEFTSESGRKTVFCPELNLLPVHAEVTGDGLTLVVSNVVLGEPDANFFRPPAGAAVKISTTPAGSGSMTELPSAAHARQNPK